VDKRYTLAAAERFADLEIPVLLAWGAEDRLFKPSHAERLAEGDPGARLVMIPDAKTFLPLDQPERLAELIAEFAVPRTEG
jgi:pimeloyl-ACP methyl ester carboxylesterase